MWYLVGAIVLFCVCFYYFFGHTAVMMFWKCLKLDVKLNYFELAGMKRKKVDINKLLKFAIKLKEQGDYDVKIKDLMQHEQSGGDIANVTNLLLTARKKKTELTYSQAAIMDMEEINQKKKQQPISNG